MKLKEKYSYSRSGDRARSIREAVASELDGHDFDSGHLEGMSRTLDKLQAFVSKLTEKLHESGALSDQAVLDLLPGYERADE